jgi:hypothetical protein
MAILFPPGDDRDSVTLAGSTFALAGPNGKMGLVPFQIAPNPLRAEALRPPEGAIDLAALDESRKWQAVDVGDPRIKRQTRPVSKPSEVVRLFG